MIVLRRTVISESFCRAFHLLRRFILQTHEVLQGSLVLSIGWRTVIRQTSTKWQLHTLVRKIPLCLAVVLCSVDLCR